MPLKQGHLINMTKIFTKLTLTSWFLTHKLFKLAMQAKHQANRRLRRLCVFARIGQPNKTKTQQR